MRRTRISGLVICLIAAGAAGCGKKTRSSHHDASAAAAAYPTPDNTPIAALRTPAGWLLVKAEKTAAAAPTPTPSAAPIPKS